MITARALLYQAYYAAEMVPSLRPWLLKLRNRHRAAMRRESLTSLFPRGGIPRLSVIKAALRSQEIRSAVKAHLTTRASPPRVTKRDGGILLGLMYSDTDTAVVEVCADLLCGSDERLTELYRGLTPREKRIVLLASGITAAGEAAILEIVRAVDHVCANEISGAFVECGVYRGGGTVTMIRALMSIPDPDGRIPSPRDIWLYDTFEGMPYPPEGEMDGDRPARQTWIEMGGTWMKVGIGEVRSRIDALNYPGRVNYVQGMVEDTLPREIPDRIALLRLDTDMYPSIKHCLEHLWPRVSPGGIVFLDDYGAFSGAKQAVDEFFGGRLFLHRIDAHVRVVVKPRE